MKSSPGFAHLDDNIKMKSTKFTAFFFMLISINDRGRLLIDTFCQFVKSIWEKKLLAHLAQCMSSIFRAIKNISGLEKVKLTSLVANEHFC